MGYEEENELKYILLFGPPSPLHSLTYFSLSLSLSTPLLFPLCLQLPCTIPNHVLAA